MPEKYQSPPQYPSPLRVGDGNSKFAGKAVDENSTNVGMPMTPIFHKKSKLMNSTTNKFNDSSNKPT